MAGNTIEPERVMIAGDVEIPRILNGLWQLAGGHDAEIDIVNASSFMAPLIRAGLEAFDMADHYGDAELVIGRHHANSELPCTAFTKWCPAENGVHSFENAEAAVNKALHRMNQASITLLQYHCWTYSDDAWLLNMFHLRKLQEQRKIRHLGLTNVDTHHLQLLLDSGFEIATNQVSCSLIDLRAIRGPMSDLCLKRNVGLLCYGTLLGGFLSEKWLDQPEPSDMNNLNWSLRKYLRFIRAAGGWAAFQGVLKAAHAVAIKHHVGIPAVAMRYVLDIPSVKAVIVGTRLAQGSEAYIARNLETFNFKLDQQDREVIAKAQESLEELPGDCGDEYRRPPFLTASGDLSHHLDEVPIGNELATAIADGKRIEYSAGTEWEPIAGYCRAVRVNNSIHVSGTTANAPRGIPLNHIGGSAAASQTVHILDLIENALKALGGAMRDVVRTRLIVRDVSHVEDVSRIHRWRFLTCEGILPANTLLIADIVGDDLLVEVEAWAHVGSGKRDILRISKY